MRYLIKATVVIMCIGLSSCKKFVQAPLPTTALVGNSVYNSNATAASALSGLYSSMTTNSVGGGAGGISVLAGLSADEYELYPGAASLQEQVYANAQLSSNFSSVWADLYNMIYQANSAISGLSNSTAVSPAIKQQLLGEAKVVRAFSYFYLVNLYGGVPLILTPNYQESEGLSRANVPLVYSQIVSDLTSAQNLLSSAYLTPTGKTTTERVRPNIDVATALLARAFLFEGKSDSAEYEATQVINDSRYTLVKNLDSAFLANNSEAIWQLELPNTGLNTADGAFLVLSNFGGPSSSFPVYLNNSLANHFEARDLRFSHWVDSIVVANTVYYYAYKYKLYYTGKPPGEYPTLLRLAEQYLIRAEARAEQGKLTGANSAVSDLNIIRNRAGLSNTTATSQTDILNAILNERRFELFGEYGHRWLDLKRTGNVNSVMQAATASKGGSWIATDMLWPIPLNDILADKKLVQNPGY